MTGPCSICACDHPSAIPACTACDCGVKITRESKVKMAVSDSDADGYADLSVGISNDFVLTTFYSNAHGNAAARRTFPPELKSNCSCSSYGKRLDTYTLLRLGGRNPDSETTNVDFVVGDITGAFATYADGVVVDGPPCDPAGDDAAQCGDERICRALCEG